MGVKNLFITEISIVGEKNTRICASHQWTSNKDNNYNKIIISLNLGGWLSCQWRRNNELLIGRRHFHLCNVFNFFFTMFQCFYFHLHLQQQYDKIYKWYRNYAQYFSAVCFVRLVPTVIQVVASVLLQFEMMLEVVIKIWYDMSHLFCYNYNDARGRYKS